MLHGENQSCRAHRESKECTKSSADLTQSTPFITAPPYRGDSQHPLMTTPCGPPVQGMDNRRPAKGCRQSTDDTRAVARRGKHALPDFLGCLAPGCLKVKLALV